MNVDVRVERVPLPSGWVIVRRYCLVRLDDGECEVWLESANVLDEDGRVMS